VSAVSEDSIRELPSLGRIWAALDRHGYAVTDDDELGLAEKFRENFVQTYFNDQILRHDAGDWPADRQRARDVVRYLWDDHNLHLREHETITITDRAGIPGKRNHARVMLLNDPEAKELVRALLGLVPPDRRQYDGTFGVNLFRTFTDVVTIPHHDNEQFIILYVLDRVGEGAESYLYRAADVPSDGKPTAKPILQQQLNPGQILIFEDDRFKHGATPLESPQGVTARRDVLVCTVDHRSTYLERKDNAGTERSALTGQGSP
jgi:hypothetical protein